MEITVAPVRLASASRSAGTSPRAHTTVPGSLTLIGPCRYSIAGYDSAQVRDASRSFSAASSATGAAQPRPRKVNSLRPASSGGSGRATSRAASAGSPRTSAPRWARSSTIELVMKRLETTERSVAKSSSTMRPASRASSASGSVVTASVGVPAGTWRNESSTSVVVPVREIYSTQSYRRVAGNSDAGKASVRPCPAASRSAA